MHNIKERDTRHGATRENVFFFFLFFNLKLCKIFSECKIFSWLVAFQEMIWKIFYGVLLCSWKCSKKHIFIKFLTFFQDPNKYYYRKSQYINTKRNKNQNKRIKITWPIVKERERERERERDWFMSDLVVATWTWWVDLKVTARFKRGSPMVVWSRSGSFT